MAKPYLTKKAEGFANEPASVYESTPTNRNNNNLYTLQETRKYYDGMLDINIYLLTVHAILM